MRFNFRYIEACLKETLRMYPSVPLIARQVTEETKIRNAKLNIIFKLNDYDAFKFFFAFYRA